MSTPTLPARLSICIPTFNRAGFIASTLDTIVAQLQTGVEIVIVDGASTDNTAEIVAPYCRRHPSIRYHRRDQNYGVDADMDYCIVLAQGAYCWLMSSDDHLKDGAVSRVLAALSSHPSLVIVNSEVRDFSMSAVLKERVLDVEDDRVFTPLEWHSFFLSTATYLTFMGCLVIDRSLWLSRDRQAYFNTEFVHVGVVFQDVAPRPAVVVATPWISIRYGNFTWADRSAQISLDKWPSMVWRLDNLPPSLRERVCPRRGWRALRRLIYHHGFDRLSRADCQKYFLKCGTGRLGRTVASVVLRLPVRLMNLCEDLYYSYLRRDGATVYLLRASPGYWRGGGRLKRTAQLRTPVTRAPA